MTQDKKLPFKPTPTDKDYGIIERPTSRRTFMKGAFTGAGALALGAYTKGGLAAVPRRVTPQRLSNVLSSAASTKRSGTLTAAMNTAPTALDPAIANELVDYVSLRQIYDGLVQFTQDYSGIEPALALSWSANADNTEWIFNLRPNVKFHDGTPFNSSAVRQSILHYVANGDQAYYGSLKTIDDSNPLVVKITLSEPAPDLAINQTWCKIISPKLLAQKNAASNRAVGTGAYQWVSWVPEHSITLAANPSYWGPAPHLDGINLTVVGNETARVDALVSGSLDLIEQVDPHDLDLLVSDSKVRLSASTNWEEICLLNVCTESPTSDVRVRQAIAYGIDRSALVRDVLLGQGSVTSSPIPPGCYGFQTPSVHYAYNPSKARQLLKEAGYPHGISLSMAGSSDLATEQLIGEAMVAQLDEAGIKVNFVVEDIGVLVSDVLSAHPKRQSYIIHYGWVGGGPWHFDVADIFAHAKYTAPALMNLIHKCNTTPDGPKRLALLLQAQDLFMQQLPHFPLYNPVNTDAFSSNVHGYVVDKDGWQPEFTYVSLS
jgi:peptide/nickel transport system substrate-binding protein